MLGNTNKLTSEQQAECERLYPVALRIAKRFGEDFDGIAGEALAKAVAGNKGEAECRLAVQAACVDAVRRNDWERERGLSGGCNGTTRRAVSPSPQEVAVDLAQECGVSSRTMERRLRTLKELTAKHGLTRDEVKAFLDEHGLTNESLTLLIERLKHGCLRDC